MDDFTKHMNAPIQSGELIFYNMQNWIICPQCGKRQFPVTAGASIKGQVFKCKASTCKVEFEVNI